jgi:phage recombination protein Bet
MSTDNLPTVINFNDPKIVATLKQTVAQGLTDEEFSVFAHFCGGTKLNPFKKETWAIKAGGRLQIMTGINGYWAIANSHPQFDGAETGMIDKNGEWVKSVPGNDFIGAWCRVHRKDRKIPMEGEAMLSDYRKSSPIWQNSPRIMIKKVAQSIALRQAFPQELNGTYTEEEMPTEYAAPVKGGAPKITIDAVAEAPRKAEAVEMIRYDLSSMTLTPEQTERMKKHCSYDEEAGIWLCTKSLGPKLEKYKVGKSLSKQPKPETKEALPEWLEAANEAQKEQEES